MCVKNRELLKNFTETSLRNHVNQDSLSILIKRHNFMTMHWLNSESHENKSLAEPKMSLALISRPTEENCLQRMNSSVLSAGCFREISCIGNFSPEGFYYIL